VKKLSTAQKAGRDVGPEGEAKQASKVLHLPARSRSRLPKNLFGEQVGEGRAAPLHVNYLQ